MIGIGIYLDSDICQLHLDQTRVLTTRYFDLQSFMAAEAERKVSAFHIPYPYLEVKQEFEQRIDLALTASDTVIILVSELHDETVDFILRYQNEKIKYFVCGTVDQINTVPWMDWLITTLDFYKKNLVLDTLTPYQPKEKLFDILLGQRKRHRTIIYNHIIMNKLRNSAIMSYLGSGNQIVLGKDTKGWTWPTGEIELLENDLNWTVTRVLYRGQKIPLSQIMPINIYNQTAYSVVAETNFSNHYSFYTEKIVKPILGRRLFLVFSGQYFLRKLRDFGFKTFHGIIDETYDTVEDFDLRGKLIIEQIDYLASQDQTKILELVKPIAEHNYQVLLETDWLGNFHQELRTVLTQTK
jgi:hypothetical protein